MKIRLLANCVGNEICNDIAIPLFTDDIYFKKGGIEEASFPHFALNLKGNRYIGIGKIHSVFSNGFNVKFENSLIFIGTAKNGVSPFGIYLDDDRKAEAFISKAIVNSPIAFCEKGLFCGDVYLRYENALRYDNKLIPLKASPDLLAQMYSICCGVTSKTGLNMRISIFLEQDILCLDKSGLNKLAESCFSEDNYFIEKALRFFLGRGEGLTPSGDDCIVGLLAANGLTQTYNSRFLDILSRLVTDEPITTDISKAYLQAALRGNFNSCILDVIRALSSPQEIPLEKAVEALLQIGHSSGVDTLLGIILGICCKNYYKHIAFCATIL